MSQERCPVCNSSKYRSNCYTEFGWGVVEEHSYCPRCGYCVEQSYSQALVGFELPQKRGYRNKLTGKYVAKNVRRRKRLARKYGIKHKMPNDWIVTYYI